MRQNCEALVQQPHTTTTTATATASLPEPTQQHPPARSLIPHTTPAQDIMRLDDTARMNVPGRAEGNWTWRVGNSDVWRQLADEQADLKRMIRMYDRAPEGGSRSPPRSGARSGNATFQ